METKSMFKEIDYVDASMPPDEDKELSNVIEDLLSKPFFDPSALGTAQNENIDIDLTISYITTVSRPVEDVVFRNILNSCDTTSYSYEEIQVYLADRYLIEHVDCEFITSAYTYQLQQFLGYSLAMVKRCQDSIDTKLEAMLRDGATDNELEPPVSKHDLAVHRRLVKQWHSGTNVKRVA
jgi:hypothetical protein